MSNVKVGLVQMSCVKDVATNIEKANREIEMQLQKELKLYVYKSFSLHYIFAMWKIMIIFS